jgi:hypothetical protein
MLLSRNHLSNSENHNRFRRNTESLSQTRSYFGLIRQNAIVEWAVNRERHAMKTIRRDSVVPKISLIFVANSEEHIYLAQDAGQKKSLSKSDVPGTRMKKLAVCRHQDRYS